MSFKDLKRNATSNFEKIKEEQAKLAAPTYAKDPNDWYPGVDKSGNGLATIRHLPRVNPDDIEIVKWYEHNFQDPNTNKYYIENCLSSIDPRPLKDGGIDPVLDFNSRLWNAVPNSLSDDEKAKHPFRVQASRQGRKTLFRTNIYVIDDSVNPENSGLPKKFQFGKWVFDAIDGLIFPSDLQKKKGVKSIDPYDMFNGPNFEIEIWTDQSKKVNGKPQRNYSKSHFVSTLSPLASEAEMEKIYNSISEWSLKAYLDPKNYKSYEILKKKLDDVVGFDTEKWTPKGPKTYSIPAEQPKSAPEVKEKDPVQDTVSSDDFFKDLVEDEIPF